MIICVLEPQLKCYHKTSKLIQTTRYIKYNMHSILFTRSNTNQSNLKHNQTWGYFTHKTYLFIEIRRMKGGRGVSW